LKCDTWTWETKDKPAASTVKRSPCIDQICRLGTKLLASEEIELTVAGTKVDNAIPPALQQDILIETVRTCIEL
jgi:hypothetical protein